MGTVLHRYHFDNAEIKDKLHVLGERVMRTVKESWGVILVTLILTVVVVEGGRKMFSTSDHDQIIALGKDHEVIFSRMDRVEEFMSGGGRFSAEEFQIHEQDVDKRIYANHNLIAQTREEFLMFRAKDEQAMLNIGVALAEVKTDLKEIVAILREQSRNRKMTLLSDIEDVH
jgi:hypothetical protein